MLVIIRFGISPDKIFVSGKFVELDFGVNIIPTNIFGSWSDSRIFAKDNVGEPIKGSLPYGHMKGESYK